MRAPRVHTPVVRLLVPANCEANCTLAGCPRGMQPIVEFAPAVSNITHKKRAAFLKIVKAINAINDVLNDPECMKLLDKAGLLRTKRCLTCRLQADATKWTSSTKMGMCRNKCLEIKAQLEEEGCVLCGCTDGMTVEHTDPNEKMRNKKGVKINLGDYGKWASLGGPEAMQAERDKPSVVAMCINCQSMQPTNNSMKEKIDPKSLPNVHRTENEPLYRKRRHLVVKHEKMAYVNAKKLAIGKCENCEYRVVPWGSGWRPGQTGYPHAFQWAHRSEIDKGKSVSILVTSHLTFEKAKPKLDKEMARCRLLCMCCGKTETDTRKKAPGPSEEDN